MADSLARVRPELAFPATVVGLVFGGVAAVLVGAQAPPPLDQIAQPMLAAWLIALAFVWRPAEALTAWLLITLFAHTIAYHVGDPILHLDEAVLPILFLVALVRHAIPGGRLGLGIKEGALAVFIAAGLLSSVVNAVPVAVFGAAFILLFKAIAVFFIVSWLPLERREVELSGMVLLTVIGLTLVLGFVEFLYPAAFQKAVGFPAVAEQRGDLNVVKSVFIHPALFAWFTAFAGLVLYAYFLVYRRWWLLLGAVAFSIGTVLSGRRRALLGMLAGLVAAAALWLRRRPSRRGVFVGAVPVVVSVVLLLALTVPVAGSFYARTLDQYLPRVELLAGIALGDEDVTDAQMRSLHPRTALYATSLAVARDHLPLGAGLGRFGSPMSRSVYSPLYDEYRLTLVFGLSQDNPNAVTDTFWPMLLGETGPIGMAAYAVFLGVILTQLWRAARTASVRSDRAIFLASLMVLVLGLVDSLAAPTFQAAPIAYFLYGTSGAALAIVATLAAREDPSMVPSNAAAGDAFDRAEV
jgi:O-Antigen ligase